MNSKPSEGGVSLNKEVLTDNGAKQWREDKTIIARQYVKQILCIEQKLLNLLCSTKRLYSLLYDRAGIKLLFSAQYLF